MPTKFMRLTKKFRIPLVVKRYETIESTNPARYEPEKSEPTLIDIVGVVSNPTQQDINFLPQGGGMQASEMFVFHTEFQLRKGTERGGTLADEIIYNGRTYTIIAIQDYNQYARYTRAIGAIKNV